MHKIALYKSNIDFGVDIKIMSVVLVNLVETEYGSLKELPKSIKATHWTSEFIG